MMDTSALAAVLSTYARDRNLVATSSQGSSNFSISQSKAEVAVRHLKALATGAWVAKLRQLLLTLLKERNEEGGKVYGNRKELGEEGGEKLGGGRPSDWSANTIATIMATLQLPTSAFNGMSGRDLLSLPFPMSHSQTCKLLPQVPAILRARAKVYVQVS